MKQVGTKLPLGVLQGVPGNPRMEILISYWSDQWKEFMEKFISELDPNEWVGFWRNEVKTDFKQIQNNRFSRKRYETYLVSLSVLGG